MAQQICVILPHTHVIFIYFQETDGSSSYDNARTWDEDFLEADICLEPPVRCYLSDQYSDDKEGAETLKNLPVRQFSAEVSYRITRIRKMC